MRKIKFLGLVVAAAIFAVSCQKGDAGPAGATGATGPAGPAGPAGPTGTANVIYSDWLDVTFDATSNIGTITAAQLTSDIINKGEVKVFLNLNSSDAVAAVPLPVTDFIVDVDANNNPFYLNVQPVLQVGKIGLFVSGNGNFLPNTFTDSGKKYYQYRYVLIPGGVKANSKVDWNNYAQVKSYLNLQN